MRGRRDRGLDNFMIKGCTCSSPEDAAASTSDDNTPHVHIAAIDNSLSFPHQHPLGWRSVQSSLCFLPVLTPSQILHLRLAVPPRLAHRTSLLLRDARALSSPPHFALLVGSDDVRPATALLHRSRFRGKDVHEADGSHEGAGVERRAEPQERDGRCVPPRVRAERGADERLQDPSSSAGDPRSSFGTTLSK